MYDTCCQVFTASRLAQNQNCRWNLFGPGGQLRDTFNLFPEARNYRALTEYFFGLTCPALTLMGIFQAPGQFNPLECFFKSNE